MITKHYKPGTVVMFNTGTYIILCHITSIDSDGIYCLKTILDTDPRPGLRFQPGESHYYTQTDLFNDGAIIISEPK